MTPRGAGPEIEADDVVTRWLRTLPEPPPTLVGDVIRRVPVTRQRRPAHAWWPPHRLFHHARLGRPVVGSLRLVTVAALAVAVVVGARATWPISRVEQLAAQHGLVVTQAVDAAVVQVLRDDAGHDLMATWPDHPRDIDRLAVGPEGAVWISSTARDSDNDHLVGAQVWRLGATGLWGNQDGVPAGVSDMAVGPDGVVWVGGSSLVAFGGGTWLPAGAPGPVGSVGLVEPAADGAVWVVRDRDDGAGSLWQLAAGRWHDRSVGAGLGPMLARHQARAVATTSDGTTWVGLFAGRGGGAGLFRSTDTGWELIRPFGSVGEDASHDVFALSAGPDGQLWAFLDSPFWGTSTDYRLARWDGATWRIWTYADGFPWDATPWATPRSAMRVAPDGTAWFARKGGGLVSFDGTASRRYLVGQVVNDFAIAPDGTVWAAVERGPGGVGGLYAILP